MKKVRLLSLILLFALAAVSMNSLYAATSDLPRVLNYQASLLDNVNNPLNYPNGAQITFRLFDAQSGGTALWTEQQNVKIDNGFINAYLGSISPLALPFNKGYWLEVQIGTDTPFPRSSFASVPYTLFSLQSESANSALAVVDNGVKTSMLTDGVVTQAKLAKGVMAIPTGTAGGDLDGDYPNPTIRNGAVTQNKLDPNVSTNPKGLAWGDLAGVYPNPRIALSAVKTDRIADGAVTDVKLADGAVTGSKLLALSITGDKIAPGTITPDKLSFNTIDNTILADNAVRIPELYAYKTGLTKPSTLADNGSVLFYNYSAAAPEQMSWSAPAVDKQSLVWDATNKTFYWGIPAINVLSPFVGNGSVTAPLTLNNSAAFVPNINSVLYLDATRQWASSMITPAMFNTVGVPINSTLVFNGVNWSTTALTTSGMISGNGVNNPFQLVNGTAANQFMQWNGANWSSSALSVNQIAQSGAALNQLIQWNGASWTPTTLAVSAIGQSGATNGQVIQWNGVNWAAGTIAPANLSTVGATTNQVLYFNGVNWTNGPAVAPTTGQQLSYNGVTLAWADPVVTSGGLIQGTGTAASTVKFAGSTANSILYGNPTGDGTWLQSTKIAPALLNTTNTPTLTTQYLGWNGASMIWQVPTAVSNVGNGIQGDGSVGTPLKFAAGGTDGNTWVWSAGTSTWGAQKLTPNNISSAAGVNNQFLSYNNGNFVWAGITTGTGLAGNGIGTALSMANGVTDGNTWLWNNGTQTWNPGKVGTANISTTGAATGQVLSYNGTNVVWSTPAAIVISSGNGLTGDGSGANPVKLAQGTINNQTLIYSTGTGTWAPGLITPSNISTVGAANGQVISYNGANVVWSTPPAASVLTTGAVTGTGTLGNEIKVRDDAPFLTDGNSSVLYYNAGWKAGKIGYTNNKFAAAPVSIGDYLAWSGTDWTWSALPAATIATDGISVMGNGTSLNKVKLQTSTGQYKTWVADNAGGWAQGFVTPNSLNLSAPANGSLLSYNAGNFVWTTSPAATVTTGNFVTGTGTAGDAVRLTASTTDNVLIGGAGGTWVQSKLGPNQLSTTGQAANSVLAMNGANNALVWIAAPSGTVITNSSLTGNGSAGSPLGINLTNQNTFTAKQTFANSTADYSVQITGQAGTSAEYVVGNDDNNPASYFTQNGKANTVYINGSTQSGSNAALQISSASFNSAVRVDGDVSMYGSAATGSGGALRVYETATATRPTLYLDHANTAAGTFGTALQVNRGKVVLATTTITASNLLGNAGSYSVINYTGGDFSTTDLPSNGVANGQILYVGNNSGNSITVTSGVISKIYANTELVVFIRAGGVWCIVR